MNHCTHLPSSSLARLGLILWLFVTSYTFIAAAAPEPIVPVCILIRVQDLDGKPLSGVTLSWNGEESLIQLVSETQLPLFQPVQTDVAGAALIYCPGTSHFHREAGKYMRRETVGGKLRVSKPGRANIDLDLAKALNSPFEREENRVAAINVSLDVK